LRTRRISSGMITEKVSLIYCLYTCITQKVIHSHKLLTKNSAIQHMHFTRSIIYITQDFTILHYIYCHHILLKNRLELFRAISFSYPNITIFSYLSQFIDHTMFFYFTYKQDFLRSAVEGFNAEATNMIHSRETVPQNKENFKFFPSMWWGICYIFKYA
jgi:hypothetical protein